MDQDGFLNLVRAVNAHGANVAAYWKGVTAAIVDLMNAAERLPNFASSLYELALTILEREGVQLPDDEQEGLDSIQLFEEPATGSAVQLLQEFDQLPGLSPAMSKILWRLLEMLKNGGQVEHFQGLLERTYGFRWQEIHVSGQLRGSAASAAKDTSSWQQLRDVVAHSIACVDRGVARINANPDTSGKVLGIPVRSLRTFQRSADEPELWAEAKQLLTHWFGLPDEEE